MSNWPLVRLGDVCEKITDGTHHSPPNYSEGDYKYITAKNIKPWGLDLTDITYVDAVTHREIYSRCDVRKDDILYVKDGATTGRLALNPLEEEFSLLSSVGVLRPGPAVRPRYLAYALQEPATLDRMLAHTAGVAITRLTLRKLNDAEVRLAPLECQDRIVEKLEELLSDLDAGVAELKAAQRKLAQYRQSLLKAAVEGALTADWRAAQGTSSRRRPGPSRSHEDQPQQRDPGLRRDDEGKETGAELLQRILRERRARWEQKQLAKFAEQGKTPPKGWQEKYPEPVAPDLAGLPSLPEGWIWTSLDTLIDDGPQNGLYLPASYYGSGLSILRIDDYQVGWHRDRASLQMVRAEADVSITYALRSGDLVINRVNSVTHLGKSILVDPSLDGALFESNMMRLRLTSLVVGKYVAYYLGSEMGRGRLAKNAKWAVNQASINQQDVRTTAIPIPSVEQQRLIAEVLELQFDAVKRQQANIENGIASAAAQRKNILKAAFSGQLVPQDPNDEPASELLARIRAQREADADTPARKRGRKAKGAA